MIVWCRYYCSRLLLVAVAGRPWLKLKVVRGVFHTTMYHTESNNNFFIFVWIYYLSIPNPKPKQAKSKNQNGIFVSVTNGLESR